MSSMRSQFLSFWNMRYIAGSWKVVIWIDIYKKSCHLYSGFKDFQIVIYALPADVFGRGAKGRSFPEQADVISPMGILERLTGSRWCSWSVLTGFGNLHL